VLPSCAVTVVVIVLAPTARAIAPEAVPLVVAAPSTLTLAVESATVGVTVSEVVALPTEAVYDVVAAANAGLRVPLEIERALRLALVDGSALAMVIV